MSTELASPLADIIKRAASAPVEGAAAKMKQRFTNCTAEIVVLADVSGSMSDVIGSSGLPKWQHLAIALKDVLTLHPKIRLVAFHSYPVELKNPAELPEPAGGTALDEALKMAAKYKPRKTIIISDGLPDDGKAALDAADKMTGQIDTIYCGPDSHPAVEWLKKLSRSTGGIQVVWDGYKQQLTSAVRGLLGPA